MSEESLLDIINVFLRDPPTLVFALFCKDSTYALLGDRLVDDIITFFFHSLLYKTDRFHVAVSLFSNRPQKLSNYGKNTNIYYRLMCHFMYVLTVGAF